MRFGTKTFLVAAVFIVLLLSLGEYRLMERLLFGSEYHIDFVLLNIEGIITGYPAGRVFQNRLLGPYLVTGIAQITNSPLISALKWYTLLMVVLENLLLGGLVYLHFQKKLDKQAIYHALTAVALFGLLRLLFLYFLEYPWDQIDILIFMLFAYWVVNRQPRWLLPLLFLTALLNRESCLFILLWFLLEAVFGFGKDPLVIKGGSHLAIRQVDWQKFLLTGLLFLGSLVFIYGIREVLFIAPTAVAGVDLDADLIGNTWNLAHNGRQFLIVNWRSTLLFVNLALITAVAFLVLVFKTYPVAAIWTGLWILSIFLFGFINETRLYLPLIAFWLVFLPLAQTRSTETPFVL